MVKLSLLPVSYFEDFLQGRKTLKEWVQEGASLGLDGIDLSILMLRGKTAAELNQFKSDLENEDMSLIEVATYPDFTSPSESKRKMEADQFLNDLKIIAQVGGKYVRVTSGQQHPGVNVEEGLKYAIEGILSTVECAESLGIQLVFENHSTPSVWKYPDFNLPLEIFFQLSEVLIRNGVKIQFDTANALVYGEDKATPLLKKVIDHVAVVHVADTKSRGTLEPVLIGTGLVDLNDVFTYLKQKSYDSWLSIEEASFSGSDGIKKAVDFVRKEYFYQ